MIINYHPNLFVLALTFSFLLLLPVVNCTTDQTKIKSIDKTIKPITINNHLYDILKQENSNNDYEEQAEEMKYFIKNILKSYPHRRASSFHAMRGKRFLKTA